MEKKKKRESFEKFGKGRTREIVGMLRIRYYMKKKSQSGAVEGKQTVKQ